jgi:uncharacterized protein
MLFEVTVPQFIHTLTNLNAILDKAAAFAEKKKIEPAVLFNYRLAADQFPLSRQIQIACDTAKMSAARLTGKEAPKNEDNEVTFPDFKRRVDQTIQYLNTFSAKDFVGVQDRKVTTPRWEGKHMTAVDYAVMHALPNFYFHMTTGYAILRHMGLEIGKGDYLGQLPLKI